MLQFFDTLTDDSGNALLGATVTVTNFVGGALATIYSANGTANPIANSVVSADITGQVSFFIPDGAYTLTYAYKGTNYKVRSPVQMLDPMGFVTATDTGAVNALVVSSAQYPAQKYIGLKLEVKVAVTNTGATTLNYQSDGGFPVTQAGGAALAASLLTANGIFRFEWDGAEWQLLGISLPTPYYATSLAETANGVTPVLFTSPWGAYRRYGADPLGVADSSTGISNAILANADVYDDYPGGGVYLVNSAEVLINKSNISIRGQSRNQRPYAVLGGTIFKIGAGLGALKSCLHIGTGPRTAITIEKICFFWNVNNLGQYAIRIGEAIGVVVNNCSFMQNGGNTGNITAIRFDGLGTYTGGVTVRDCYCSNVLLFANLLGVCTTVRFIHNELYGNMATVAGGVTAFGAITAGSGYANGTYTAVQLTGGTGYNCLANITVAGGAVTACTVNYGGSGYLGTDTLSATSASLGGGSGFSIPVSTIGNGAVGTGIRIAAPSSDVMMALNDMLGWAIEIDSTATYPRQMGNHFEADFTGAAACFRWRRGAGSISTGATSGVGAITAGTGYTNGTYINVPLTGGLGSGALANITVAGGGVTAVDIVDNGIGFAVNDSLTASNQNLGGAGSGFSFLVAAIVSNQRIWGESDGEIAIGLSGFTPIFPQNNFDKCRVLGQITNYIDEFPLTMPIASNDTSGFTYSNNPGQPIGQWKTPTFAAGNFTANGAMTWTVGAGAVVTYEFELTGKKMTVNWMISGGTAAGTGNTELRIAIPGGFKANARTFSTCVIVNNAVAAVGSCQVQVNDTFIRIFKDVTFATNWVVGGVQADTYGSFTFEVQ